MSGSLGISGSSSSPRDVTPRIFKDERGFVIEQLKDRIQTGGPQITGPFAVDIGDAEQRGLDVLEQNTFGKGGLANAQEGAIRSALAGGEQNPFLDEAITAATRPLIEGAELQELQDRAFFTGAGQLIQGSSAFTAQRRRGLNDLQRNIGDVSSSLAFADVIRRTEQRLEAVNLANSIFSNQRETITALALPRLIEQFGLEEANEELRRRFTVTENALTELGNFTAPTIATDTNSFAFNTSGGGGGGGTGGS